MIEKRNSVEVHPVNRVLEEQPIVVSGDAYTLLFTTRYPEPLDSGYHYMIYTYLR